MKVICINEEPRCNDMNVYLTKGKIYNVEALNTASESFPENYGLVNDMGRIIFVACDAFKPIDEFRNDKIEEIINEHD